MHAHRVAVLLRLLGPHRGVTIALIRSAGTIASTEATHSPVAAGGFDAMLKMELPEGYGVGFCPMAFDFAGASWIQREGEIMNPYYGSGMLHCGAFK